jgi:uncharacterized protein (TIGR02996 family)
MTDSDRFLRAIEADFESDAPRLVFADWLDEHGDPDRAAFIRLQCEHAALTRPGPPPTAAGKKKAAALEAKADALLARNRDRWTAGLPKWAADARFDRGFPIFYFITGKQLADDGAALRRVAPLGGYLALRLLKGREAAVFASPHLEYVTRLGLEHCQLTDAGVAVLATAPHLGRVWELDLSRGGFGSLDKDVNRLTDAAALTLAAADNLPALTALDLGEHKKLTAAGVRAILESPTRAGLTSLDVGGGPGGPAFAELFRSPGFRLTRLTTLNVGGRKLGDAGAAVLAGCPAMAGLTELHLHSNGLTDRGATTILDSPHLRNLRRLSFYDNPKVTDATARRLLADGRPWEAITLTDTGVGPALIAEVGRRCGG